MAHLTYRIKDRYDIGLKEIWRNSAYKINFVIYEKMKKYTVQE